LLRNSRYRRKLMYLVVEYGTLLLLTALVLSVLLGFSVAFMMVQEGVATVWKMSRRVAGNGAR
jgi:hypothetical protein